MRTPRIAALLLAGVLTLGLAAGASAQAQGQRRGGQQQIVLPALWLTRLSPNADQQAKLKAAEDAYKAEAEKIMALATPQEKRAATMAARKTYEDAVKAALNEEQNKKLDVLRADAREFQAMGPAGMQIAAVGLTPEQKTKVKEIVAKYQPELEKARAGATDAAAGREATREISMKMMQEVRAILTPEQLKSLPMRRPQNQ